MEQLEWVKIALSKWKDFSGRSRRSEYWWFTLALVVASFVAGMIDGFIGLGGSVSVLVSLATLIPGIAVSIRRLHDTDKSGWWLLAGFVPFVGWLVILYFTLLDSQPGTNRYGPNPKGVN